MNDTPRRQLDLSGTVAVVTGGTRGVGLAITRKLISCGVDVVAGYRRDDLAAKHLETAYGERVTTVAADLTSPTGLARLLAAARQRYGRIDVFVHAAGTLHAMSALGIDPAGVEADVRLALVPLLGASAIAELMADGGRIIVISSHGARVAAPRYVSAGIAKAAAESLVRYLAVELAGRGIAVNAVSTAKIDKGSHTPNPEIGEQLAARTPGGRLTTPEDVANVVALLCTPEAGWIHGQVITVDGGLSVRG
ncbi:MAG TPA: SDR family oxidoreductase [Micromonospora sp.]